MIERLKEDVLKKYGSQLQYTKDCKILANEVFEQTGEMLSTTTIRRLFGFLKSTSSPSKFTLNVLVRYIGHNSWDEYVKAVDEVAFQSNGIGEKWDSLYKRAIQLSEYTYNLIREQSGLPFDAVVEREFAEERIAKFLDSSYMSMSFVAPGGYGKSSMLGKWFQRNWSEKKSEDIVLFLNADFLINFLNNDFKLDRWIQDQLGYANENIFNYFLENPQDCQGKIIIVLDALDEITYDVIKLERLFLQLTAFIANYKTSDKIKLIVTSRNSTWEKFALPLINNRSLNANVWYGVNMEYVSADKTNMHPLNEEEIQKVLAATINSKANSNFLWEELSFSLKQTISYPYFLELFVKLYNPNSVNTLNEGIDLIDDFLKKKIYYSRFSDEKLDILMGILTIQDLGRSGNAVKKNELKRLYPVHLKSAGNYFYAYEEMLSYGILSEVMMDNRFGSCTKYVQISHQFLFELLVVQKLIEENDGINFSLFQKVEKEFTGFEYRNRLIGLLYSFAYREEDQETLCRFFDLEDETLQDRFLMEMVGRSFRKLNGFGKELLACYSKNDRACNFLFEKFVDLNYLMGSYRMVVEEFMKNNNRKGIAITCAGILLHASIYSLNQADAEKYYQFLKENEPDTTCSAYAIAIRLAGLMLYRQYFTGESNEETLAKLFYYREMAYSSSNEYLVNGDGEFELIVCNALLQIKAFNKILMLVDDAEKLYKTQVEGVVSGNYMALQCYRLYAQLALGMPVDGDKVKMLKFSKTELSPARGFVIRIVYNSFMADYHFANGCMEKAEYHLDKAIEISEFASYDLCTAGLLEKMALFYSKWGDENKQALCMSERNTVVGNSTVPSQLNGIIV